MTPARPSMRLIIAAVSAATGVRKNEILSVRRPARSVDARLLICWLARRMTLLSMPAIGRALNGRDHTTILSNIRRADERMQGDVEFREQAEQLEQTIGALATRKALNKPDPNPIAAAQRVIGDPERHAVQTATDDIVAMAALLLDYDEIVGGMNEYFAAKDAPPSEERDELLAALEPTLKSCIAALGRPTPSPEKTHG